MRTRSIAVLVATVIAAACNGGPTATGNPSPTITGSPGASPVAVTPSAPPTAPATTAPDATGPLPQIELEAHTSLTFEFMTGLEQLPDGRWLVLEQPGRIMTFREGDAAATVFLELSDRVLYGGEQGLLGLAPAPDFATSGVFFVNYTTDGPRRTIVSSFTSSGAQADRASERLILEVDQPYANHNGGQLAFGPDGYLYVALGDGGSGGDPHGNGQNRDALLGKILRLDVSDRARYSVPPDNPFVGQAGRPEIWAYGLRNPWRFSFDTANGALWAADVGQNAIEEIDLIVKGGNYGWNVMEGTRCYAQQSCDTSGLILPVVEYTHEGGACSVTGGFVYRGSLVPALVGAYVYGDYCTGQVWAVRAPSGAATDRAQIAATDFRIGSFARDRAGEIYVLEHAGEGRIFRIAG